MKRLKISENQATEGLDNKSIGPNNMTSAVKTNLKLLNDAVKKIKPPNIKEKAKELIKLYEERKISKAKTVSSQLFDFIAFEK